MYKLVQLFALGLAASTAANGLQIPAAGNVGLTRRVAVRKLLNPLERAIYRLRILTRTFVGPSINGFRCSCPGNAT